jgi:phosphatidylinositol dimannoside acyltransferase
MAEATSDRSRLPAGGVDYAPHRRPSSGGAAARLVERARERTTVGAYRLSSRALAAISLGVSLPVARALFLAAYVAWPEKRRYIKANAAHILGASVDDPEVGRLARRIYATYARYVVELMRLPSRPADEAAGLVVADGVRGVDSFSALYDGLRREGRGMIAVTAHIGNIEALAAAFAHRGWPAYALADDSAYPELFELLAEQRLRWGVRIIAWRNLREMYRVLRDGAILGLVVDWGYRADGIPVQLFGRWTTLPGGPAMLAARTHAAIVPVHTRRRPDGRFEALHSPPIEVANASDAEIARATQAIAAALEEMVAAAPEQWYTFKPMWPDNARDEEMLATRWREMTRQEGP